MMVKRSCGFMWRSDSRTMALAASTGAPFIEPLVSTMKKRSLGEMSACLGRAGGCSATVKYPSPLWRCASTVALGCAPRTST